MKALTFIGSPRKKGNSEIAARNLQVTLHRKNPELHFDIIRADELEIKPCTGCGYCDRQGKCILTGDDMQEIYAKIEQASIINFVTPVYFGSMSGILKVLIDRLQPYYSAKYLLKQPRITGGNNKRMSLIVVSGRNDPKYARNIQEIIEVVAVNLNFAFTQTLHFPRVDQKGDINQAPAFDEQIQELAQLLTS